MKGLGHMVMTGVLVAVQLMNVSAYTYTGNVTASGASPTPYRTAACDHLPMGTMVYVNGRVFVIEDRFGGGYSDRLDLFLPTEAECWEFGRQYLWVDVFE